MDKNKQGLKTLRTRLIILTIPFFIGIFYFDVLLMRNSHSFIGEVGQDKELSFQMGEYGYTVILPGTPESHQVDGWEESFILSTEKYVISYATAFSEEEKVMTIIYQYPTAFYRELQFVDFDRPHKIDLQFVTFSDLIFPEYLFVLHIFIESEIPSEHYYTINDIFASSSQELKNLLESTLPSYNTFLSETGETLEIEGYGEALEEVTQLLDSYRKEETLFINILFALLIISTLLVVGTLFITILLHKGEKNKKIVLPLILGFILYSLMISFWIFSLASLYSRFGHPSEMIYILLVFAFPFLYLFFMVPLIKLRKKNKNFNKREKLSQEESDLQEENASQEVSNPQIKKLSWTRNICIPLAIVYGIQIFRGLSSLSDGSSKGGVINDIIIGLLILIVAISSHIKIKKLK